MQRKNRDLLLLRFFPKPYSSSVSGEKHQPSPVGRPLPDAHPVLLGLPSPPARLPLCQHPCRACATHGPERGPLRSHTPESLDSPERPPSAPGPARGPRGLWACCLLASSGLWQLFPSLLRTWPVLRGDWPGALENVPILGLSEVFLRVRVVGWGKTTPEGRRPSVTSYGGTDVHRGHRPGPPGPGGVWMCLLCQVTQGIKLTSCRAVHTWSSQNERGVPPVLPTFCFHESCLSEGPTGIQFIL